MARECNLLAILSNKSYQGPPKIRPFFATHPSLEFNRRGALQAPAPLQTYLCKTWVPQTCQSQTWWPQTWCPQTRSPQTWRPQTCQPQTWWPETWCRKPGGRQPGSAGFQPASRLLNGSLRLLPVSSLAALVAEFQSTLVACWQAEFRSKPG